MLFIKKDGDLFKTIKSAVNKLFYFIQPNYFSYIYIQFIKAIIQLYTLKIRQPASVYNRI
jgi:hypothetical protein